MGQTIPAIATFLASAHPYDNLSAEERTRIAATVEVRRYAAGARVYTIGDALNGVFVIMDGEVQTADAHGTVVSRLTTGETFGERGFLRDGRAATTAHTTKDSAILALPAREFRRLVHSFVSFQRYFDQAQRPFSLATDISTQRVSELLARAPLSCAPHTPVAEAAQIMRDHHVSSLGVTQPDTDILIGIVTVRDLANRVLAQGRDPATPVGEVMSADPLSLPPDALGADVLHHMLENAVGHVPIVDDGRFVGMVTQTDITRFQAISSVSLAKQIAEAHNVAEMATISKHLPSLLVQLVDASHTHDVVTRVITDISDAITRRLLEIAEEELGPAPVPYLWLACGSQGRQEQTGVSDQDNCLILDDSVTSDDMTYFAGLARMVSDGLNACGYVYCPGDMMATNPRWCQPLRVWRDYFRHWATTHEPESQMLASVMFDLRAIRGKDELYGDLQAETLALASSNSIFLAHMIANSLEHSPPLGIIRGFATLRSGPYRNHIDMKMHGVIPVTDLARVYALQGRIAKVNTRARILAAGEAGVVSPSGARDLVQAYDVIAMLRLQNQGRMIKYGREPTNYLTPADLSDFERNHLRDAFVVVRTMQAAVGHGKAVLR